MDFPHIKDTNFPNVQNVDVYKYQNNFDYGRWTGKVSIKLLNVLWNSDYSDVVYFENETKRDEWFDSQDGIIKTLESAFNITPENNVRIPVPYNDAYRYNYLCVDMPMQTSATEPIDYEIENLRVSRWYYFIDSMVQLAPNTTELHVTLDAWTTFSHTIEVPYLMLERGHAPMVLSDVDDYLENPIENSEYLLAQDFNYGTDARIISRSSYIPIGNGSKYVLFALPMTQADLLTVGGSLINNGSTPPTFSDIAIREGYQLQVNDYLWNYGNVDYSSANLKITALLSDEAVFNGNYMFAVSADDAHDFFNVLASRYVHLLHAIQACYMVAEDMISFGTGFLWDGFTLYQVDKNYSEFEISLMKSGFGFDEKYENITKLYTYPYSVLEVTDDNGFKREVRIENTGNIKFHKEVALAFPYVRYQTFFSGLNGNGEFNYVWKNIHDENIQKTMWESDFSDFMMKWDIPTFAVYVSSENEFAANNFAPMRAAREGAIVDYQNAVRYANTSYENTDDETDALVDNVQTQNECNNDMTANANAAARSNTQVNNFAQGRATFWNNEKLNNDYYNDTTLSGALTGTANSALAATTAANNGARIASAGVNAVTGIIGGAISDGGKGAAGGAISGGASLINTGIAVDCANAVMSIQIGANVQNLLDVAAANARKVDRATMTNTEVNNITQDAHRDVTENSCNANTLNTGRQNTASMVEIVRTTETLDANANYTRGAGVAAAQDNLRQKQREWTAKYKSNNLAAPTMETQFAGDAYPDVYERRGVRVNIRTQSKSAIAQAGDAMLRFGYALHRIWDMSNGFNYGKHFTFWKAEDIWINEGSGLAGNSVEIIRDILLKGVTVWRKPDEVGKIGLYDNI